jgi:integrase
MPPESKGVKRSRSRNSSWIAFFLDTGLRSGEVCGLTLEDAHLDDRYRYVKVFGEGPQRADRPRGAPSSSATALLLFTIQEGACHLTARRPAAQGYVESCCCGPGRLDHQKLVAPGPVGTADEYHDQSRPGESKDNSVPIKPLTTRSTWSKNFLSAMRYICPSSGVWIGAAGGLLCSYGILTKSMPV